LTGRLAAFCPLGGGPFFRASRCNDKRSFRWQSIRKTHAWPATKSFEEHAPLKHNASLGVRRSINFL
jgi:hypothetical protein